MQTMKTMSALALASAVTLSGCATPAATVEKVPGGASVELPAGAKFREFTVPEGTRLAVRMISAVGSDTSRAEDLIEARLLEAVVIDGVDVFPVESLLKGTVTTAQAAGKVKGRASLALRFTSVTVPGRDELSAIDARTSMAAASTQGKDAATIGIPAAGGAIIGGIAGGKKGAVIGTAVGGGGGTAVVLSTSGDEIRLANGARLTLPIAEDIQVRIPIAQSN